MDYIQTEPVCKSEYTSCSEIALRLRFFIADQMARWGALASPCALSTFQGTGTGSGAAAAGRMISKELILNAPELILFNNLHLKVLQRGKFS